MNKLRTRKNRKHLITLVCLLVGMLVLTTAVYANSDDAKGYSSLKEAVKQLALYEDNYTLDGEMNATMDDVTFRSAIISQIRDGDDSASITKQGTSGYSYENYIVDGKAYHYYPEEGRYYSNNATDSNKSGMKDPMVKKTVSFVELLGDTLIGDLKNNVVYMGGENGSKDYTVNISGTQVPEVVNAGLSLMIGTQNSSQKERPTTVVTYENYMLAVGAYFEKETGESFSQAAYENGTPKTAEMEIAMREHYDGILKSKGDLGVLFVNVDGSYDYYGTYDEYLDGKTAYAMGGNEIFEKMGNDPYIDSVLCDFSIDKDGNLSALNLKAAMSGKDDSGEKHTISMEIKGTAKDFGSSKVVLPDFSKATDESR